MKAGTTYARLTQESTNFVERDVAIKFKPQDPN